MEPAVSTGDVVVEEEIPASAAVVGNIVTFKDPEGSGTLITHRVRSVRGRAGRLEFTTRGDANNAFDRWSVPVGAKVGRVTYRVPKLGYALVPLEGIGGRVLLIVLPALLLLMLGLARIWFPERFAEQRTGETS
jgi:signal peptidase